ncbi:furostanol glycoside 26-O-beta-glucosidase-like isoform X2 [Phoenix dactylifera]|uniref:Furostanol glycoside 26-O-beta-glucosidase-like isoform X2 n=1 Tax=Phoenix dactylifera TaxID=42345 RepID=A0A8B9B0G2_PHODC|nr:furostanol glycoside 26-O-beta-glucosidase-like isoform X2 [Phoenix dactylifera]
MALLSVVPIATTHAAPQLPRLGSKGLASLEGKARMPLSTNKTSHFLNIRCNQGDAAVVNDAVEAKPSVLLGRKSFPTGFTFGAASSAYQIEGGVDSRGENIWDTFCRKFPDKIADKSNGDVAVDSYNRYQEDVKLLKDMGVDAYRFSISWSRILPSIEPFVTLFHWDVPQALEDEYGGFLDRRIVDDFKDYVQICYYEFGDRVKHWITLNEPWTFSSLGYGLGTHAPGRCSKILGCPCGDSTVEPYIVTHNLILAHAEAARLYKDKFQASQQGEVGITLVCMWYEPYDHLHMNDEAKARALDFMLAWYMDPLVHGDYPFNMRAIVRDRLPYFTDEESTMIKGSFDFIGLNYYTARYARSVSISPDDSPILHINEAYAEQLDKKDEVPIGDESGTWIYVYPNGLKDLLMYIKRRYDNPPIYITENGICEVDKPDMSLEEALNDKHRRDYLNLHLSAIRQAMGTGENVEGANVKGYFAWSLTDNFEWKEGYTHRFGLTYIDYKDNLKRYPKLSTEWFTQFLKS